MARVGLAAAGAFPDGDEDAGVLGAALTRHGVDARWAVWDDEAVDWAAFDLVVVRATWDYAPRRDAFLTWAERVTAVTRLANPAPVLRWNTDKRYLRELARAGVPVVDTAWLEPGERVVLPPHPELVVKPAVSAGARDTARYRRDEASRATAHAALLLDAGRTVMVQPYLDAVDTAGETALVFVDGGYSHALRKDALLTEGQDQVAGLYREEQMESREPSRHERDLAEQVLDAVPFRRDTLLYARVDLLPGTDGAPVLLELELAEPSLFLAHAPVAAADRFAAAIARAARDLPAS